jgi:hypothetical protein
MHRVVIGHGLICIIGDSLTRGADGGELRLENVGAIVGH